MGSGAIFNAVKRSDVEQIRLLWPTNERIATFSEIADPIFDQILALTRSNRILQQTRDLLLPRLISGEIDVSGLDIELADSSV
jgi:type I restriction enzyme S subunit